MKIIGNINHLSLFKDESEEIKDATYLNGCIVMLSESEIRLLKALQDAWDGEVFRFDYPYYSSKDCEDIEMSNIFKAIRSFIDIKFSVNEFRVAIDRLDNILIKENDEL